MKNYTRKEITQFSIIMSSMVCFVGYVVFPFLYDLHVSWELAAYALAFPVFAILLPNLVRPIYWLWIKLSTAIGWLNTRLILLIVYFGLIAPMGLIARIFGYNPMRKKSREDTYYIKIDRSDNDMRKPF